MRDRRVTPVEDAQPFAVGVEVRHVEVVVLDRLWYVVWGEVGAELREARRKTS